MFYKHKTKGKKIRKYFLPFACLFLSIANSWEFEVVYMLRVENLVKKFGDFQAVDNVSFNVEKGEAFALLGPNGAGKTTTIRMLTTLSLPTSGKVTINGFGLVEQPQEIKKCIGIVHQRMNIDNELTAQENLLLHARLHHMDMNKAKKRITDLLEFVELTERKDQVIKTFSGGMKRRLMIARAILHEPQILFLDEPTVGLDPQVRRRIWELIRQMHGQGMSLILTTHYIEEAEQLCQRVAIMNKGKLLVVEEPKVLCERYGKYIVEDYSNDYAQKFFNSRQEALDYSAQCVGNSYVRKVTLEDVFVELTGKKVTDL